MLPSPLFSFSLQPFLFFFLHTPTHSQKRKRMNSRHCIVYRANCKIEPLSESIINLYPKRISPLFFLFPLNGLTKIPLVLRGFRPTNFFLFTLSNLLILSLSIAFSDHPSLTLFQSSLAYLAPIVHACSDRPWLHAFSDLWSSASLCHKIDHIGHTSSSLLSLSLFSGLSSLHHFSTRFFSYLHRS